MHLFISRIQQQPIASISAPPTPAQAGLYLQHRKQIACAHGQTTMSKFTGISKTESSLHAGYSSESSKGWS